MHTHDLSALLECYKNAFSIASIPTPLTHGYLNELIVCVDITVTVTACAVIGYRSTVKYRSPWPSPPRSITQCALVFTLGSYARRAGHSVLLLSFRSFCFFSPPNLRGRSVDRHQTLPHVRWWPRFIKLGQRLGPSPKTSAAPKHQNFDAISDIFATWSRISPDRFAGPIHPNSGKKYFSGKNHVILRILLIFNRAKRSVA